MTKSGLPTIFITGFTSFLLFGLFQKFMHKYHLTIPYHLNTISLVNCIAMDATFRYNTLEWELRVQKQIKTDRNEQLRLHYSKRQRRYRMLDKGLGILSTVHRPNVLIKATIKASTRAILHRCYRNDNPKDELSETPLPSTKDTFHHSRLAEIQPPISVNFLSSISLFYALELVRSVLIVKNQCN